MKFFNKLLRDEAGATAIEYGLIAALIAVAAIAAMDSLGTQLTATFTETTEAMANEDGGGGNTPPEDDAEPPA